MALALGLVTSVCVLRGSAKPGPPNGVQMVGRANLKSPLRRTGDSPPCQVTAEDVDRGWRVAATRKEISR